MLLPSTARDWAERIVAHETRAPATPAGLALGLKHLLLQLEAQTSTLIGAFGFEALFSRAVDLTRPDWPAGRSLEHLTGLVEREGVERTTAGATLLVANLIALLCAFIGEQLTFRVLARVWPALLEARLPAESQRL
jgi:hypothetical protein